MSGKADMQKFSEISQLSRRYIYVYIYIYIYRERERERESCSNCVLRPRVDCVHIENSVAKQSEKEEDFPEAILKCV